MQLELLAPAKNYEFGCAAIDHGADAVYIGAPAFGARSAATNSIADVERLVRYAHLFHSKVFATVNTVLYDDELEAAVQMCHQLYEAGCDALIIQDMGLLECDLPPIELHASTQCHNADIEKIQFLEQVGFRRVILARETSLEQMRAIRQATQVDLESFIHGALCVSYSGQCYLSQALNNRSGNRGECSQPCRSTYNLVNEQGTLLQHKKHLLSLKDFSAAQHIESMADAGISSFKIEGRLKDIGYVKNVTAYYRQLLDTMMERRSEYTPASSGHCRFHFIPDPEKTFNRGFCDYFLQGRQSMASLSTQKSIGKEVGHVLRCDRNKITVAKRPDIVFSPGDGLCYLNADGELEGFLVNAVQGDTLIANKSLSLATGTVLRRNHDQQFEKQLEQSHDTRKIDIRLILSETSEGYRLQVTDSDGCQAEGRIACEKTLAENPERCREQIESQLSKTGATIFHVTDIQSPSGAAYFISAALLNALRRSTLERLEQVRFDRFRPQPQACPANDSTYPQQKVNYLANINNRQADTFYRRHQAEVTEWGVEQTHDYRDKALMTTRYCLRYELGACLQHKCNKAVAPDYQGALYLENNGRRFRLHFDCARCRMQIFLCE